MRLIDRLSWRDAVRSNAFQGVATLDIGDRVVYPMHGAGVVESKVSKQSGDQEYVFYVMKLPLDEMKLTLPESVVAAKGIRPVMSVDDADAVLESLAATPQSFPGSWGERQRAQMNSIRKGEPLTLAPVVRDLTAKGRARPLAGGDQRILDSARQLLISEFLLVPGVGDERVAALVGDLL